MAESVWQGSVPPASLRRAMRHALRSFAPDLRVVAEEYLGESSAIDLLAVGPRGELVCVRIAPPDDTAEAAAAAEAQLLVRGLSDLDFMGARVGNLHELAPNLGLEATALPRVVLAAPRFGGEVRSAIRVIAPGRVELIEYRCRNVRGQLTLLLEALPADPGATGLAASSPATHARRPPDAEEPPQRPDASEAPDSGFRTGLSDADLRLEAATPAGNA